MATTPLDLHPDGPFDLIDEVEDIVGAARMMRDAANSKVHFFI